MPGKSRDGDFTQATKAKVQRVSQAMRLAQLDFALAPTKICCEQLHCRTAQLTTLRRHPDYIAGVEEIRKVFKEEMLRTPGTEQIRQTISHAMALGAKRITEILSDDKTVAKDLIAAAKLAAQMDGRFLGADAGEQEIFRPDEHKSTVASELLQALDRHKKSIQ